MVNSRAPPSAGSNVRNFTAYGFVAYVMTAVLSAEVPMAVAARAKRGTKGRLDSTMNMTGESVVESASDDSENIFILYSEFSRGAL